MTEKHEIKSLPKLFLKGVIVIGIAFLMAFALNSAMQSFLDAEVEEVKNAAMRAAEAEKALLEAKNKAEAERLEAELAVKKAEQYESFYQKYKNRDNYHYYGQFYEMFENMYNADTIIIGTSHAAHGINPLYLEDEIEDISVFNFALNGSNPKYYVDWLKVFEESGYPIPKNIIFAVDWFMFDDGWLWRRIDFDTNPDCPVDIMRKIKASEKVTAAETEKISEGENNMETEAKLTETEPAKAEEKINWFDIDEVTTYLFSRIPIIYSRDRIPEMISYYINGKVELDNEEESSSSADSEINSNNEIPEVPVFKHEELKDSVGNITSSYYKGYIPWDVHYSGGTALAGCNNNNMQKESLNELLDKFEEWGCNVVFIQVPEYIEGRNAPQYERENGYLEKIAEERGITYYNYNKEYVSDINRKPSNYSDWGHLSLRGSETFSKVLAKNLAEYYKNVD